jgi:hypothetical protein
MTATEETTIVFEDEVADFDRQDFDAIGERLVGETPTATNQPTNDETGKAWDMGNDMLVVLTPDGKIAIGDPAPVGTVIGQFVPVDNDHGIVEWASDWDVVRLRELVEQYNASADQSLELIAHLMSGMRGIRRCLSTLIVGSDEAKRENIVSAINFLMADPCDICDSNMPGESLMDFLKETIHNELVRRKVTAMLAERAAQAADENAVEDAAEEDGF